MTVTKGIKNKTVISILINIGAVLIKVIQPG